LIKKAMIMAAGAGTRLNPLTLKVPKPMIPVANVPILEFILKHLQSHGINDVVANTHHLADRIHNVYSGENHLGINFKHVYEPELSGTAGGVKKTEFFFDENETFIVVSGDALTDVDIESLYEKHKSSDAIATLALREVPMEDVEHFGVVVIDKNSRITGFQEKPKTAEAKSNLANTGIYMFEKRIFDYIPANTFYDFGKQVFPDLLNNEERFFAHVINDYWNDIGTIRQYKLSSFEILENKMKCTGAKAIGENTIIEEGATLSGSNVIGNNCIIKAGAHITNSIIWDNAVIEGNTKINDCIIANNVKICAGNNETNSVIAENPVKA